MIRAWKSFPSYCKYGLLLYTLTFLLVLPVLCRDLKYSVYFTKGENYTESTERELRAANTERVQIAKQFLTGYTAGNWSVNGHPRVALTIITVSRNRHKVDEYEPYYLTQVVAHFLHFMQETSLPLNLTICNVDTDPESYTEAKWLETIVPTIRRYKTAKEAAEADTLHILEKEKRDYVFCLKSSLSSGANYAFLVEDDALPHKDLFQVLPWVIRTHLDNQYLRGEFQAPPSDMAYVKFYHPPHLLKYFALEGERLSELFGLGALLGTLLLGVINQLWPLPSGSLHFLWVILMIYVILVVFALGRPNMQEVRRIWSPYLYSYTPAPSCCTPAMLFTRESGTKIVNHLSRIRCRKDYGKDSALDDFLRWNKLGAHLVQPNTFTHIGMYSSLRKKLVDPFLV